MTTYKLDDGLNVPPADKGGRPLDERLAEIDERAAKDVISGKFESDNAAAEAYLTEYARRGVGNDEGEIYRHKLKDIVKRIRVKRQSIQQ